MLFRTIIVKNKVQKAKDMFAFALGDNGSGMFITELTDGSFISSGYLDKVLAEHLPLDELQEDSLQRSFAGNAEAVRELITENGKEMTLADIQSVFDDMEITDEEPFVAMLRRGVEIKTSAE